MEHWGVVSLEVYVICGECNHTIDTNDRELSISHRKVIVGIGQRTELC